MDEQRSAADRVEPQVGGVPTSAVRIEYTGPGLADEQMTAAPWPLVSRFLAEAVAEFEAGRGAGEPNVLDLATVDADGMPDVRPVIMKQLDERGPTFITDAHSAKAAQLAHDPRVAVTLRWPRLYRVVRMRGVAEPLTRDELEAVWVERPRGAQVSACVSLQSQPVADRAALEEMVARETRRLEDELGEGPVPMPEAFVGWRVRPQVVEVWAGRESRLHDRVRYLPREEGGTPPLDDAGAWTHARLQP